MHRGMVNEGTRGVPRMSYEDIRSIMDRKLAQQKRGILTDAEVASIVKSWQDKQLEEEEVDVEIVEREVRRLEKKFQKFNVPMVGSMPIERPDGVFRVMYCQLNSCSGKEVREVKTSEVMALQRRYQINAMCLNELGFNWSAVEASRNLSSWFEDERETRCVAAHNTCDPSFISKHQQGGTGIVVMHEFLQYARNSSKDFRGMGRWCSFAFWVNPKHKFRLIVAYNVCKGKPKGLKTVYQQQLRAMQDAGLSGSPRSLFEKDFVRQCKQWRKEGDRLFLFVDANEHVTKGRLFSLLGQDGIEIEEASNRYWGRTPPHTFINGTDPIDGVGKSKEVEIVNFAMLPFSQSPGDHRTFIVDISTRSMIGKFQYKIQRPVSRRLVTSNVRCTREYKRLVEIQFELHRIPDRMQALENLTQMVGRPTPEWLEVMMQKIHKQIEEIQTHGEAKCRKILTPASDYSPRLTFWYDRRHAYMWLLRIQTMPQKNHNRSHAFRFARRCKIDDPHGLTVEQLKEGLVVTSQRIRTLRSQAKGLRKVHLRDCLLAARGRGQKAKAARIQQVISREHMTRMWYYIKRVTKDPHSPSILKVQRMRDGRVVEYDRKEDVEGAIQKECEVRFTLAHSAPVAKTLLGDRLKYFSDEVLARSIIDGTYEIPEDLEPATALVVEAIGEMGMKIINGEGQEIVISPDEFRRFWKRVGEFTSSSPSNKHYGHYKAAAQSEMITGVLSKQLTVVARSGVPPDRWPVVLQVMLEKVAGICLVERLRSIQLYEADYNFYNQFIFGQKAMSALTEHGYLPEEHFSQKGSTAEDAKFDKTLMADLSRQARHPMAIVSVDASNCYDRVNHVIMSLVWLALLGMSNFTAIAATLFVLQSMRFYQRTGFGDSETFFGGNRLLKLFQGLGQGNRAAPPSWIMLSSVLVNVFRGLDYGAKICDPITRAIIHSMGALFVDDTDLYKWGERLMSSEDVWEELQHETTVWGQLLIATGGAFKPEKCFWYMLDYECVDGTWDYTELVPFELVIPLPDGSFQTIQQEDVHQSKKTLGIWDCPAGGNAEHLDVVGKKMETWVSRMKNGHLPSHMARTSYTLQLWPGLRYGIGTLTNDLEEALDVLGNSDFEVLPILGIARTVKKRWRRLHFAFGGFGLLNFPTEQLIARLNLFLQHYHTSSALSQKLDASLRYLQLQLGTNKCPFELEYDTWSWYAPLSWLKMFWRSVQVGKIDLQVAFSTIPLPREQDRLVMEMVHEYTSDIELRMSLARCRGALSALFLSDLVTADGRNLESFVFDPGGPHSTRSRYKFPREVPTEADWSNWRQFWQATTDEGFTLRLPLGRWLHPTHRIWQWFRDESSGELLHLDGDQLHHYLPATGGRRLRSQKDFFLAWTEAVPNEWEPPSPTSIRPSQKDEDDVCAGRDGPALVAHGPSRPEDFWQFLEGWGGEWMWEHLCVEEPAAKDLTWVIEGMQRGSLVWVTDGSYDPKRAPNVSGAGWLVYCTTTRLMLRGSFYEVSSSANSYRGELLGLCAIHLLASALEEFFDVGEWSGKICCDNKAALFLSSRIGRRIKPSAKCADILRSVRSSKIRLKAHFHYEHVDSHMDRFLLWRQLTLEQQLNCICDNLAKSAVARSIHFGQEQRGRQLLPREDTAVFIDGKKATSDFAKPIRYGLSKEHARVELPQVHHWAPGVFDEVAWEWLDKTLESKPEGYRVWLSKQHTGFCGTRVQVAYYSGDTGADVGCPNCGMRETAQHLCVCPDEDRTRLLQEMTEDMGKWMGSRDNTYSEIAYWVPKYILCRGTRKFSELGAMSPRMRQLAASQDRIGWRNFMEGRVSKHFYSIQQLHLTVGESYLSGDDWMKHFITRLLHITHSQWIYRNFSLHDRRQGYLRRLERMEVLKEIERLADTNPDEVPEESKFLLEFDFDRLYRSKLEDQQYWVIAVKAARKAGMRRAAQGRSARRISQLRQRQQSLRQRLGVSDAERQIHLDGRSNEANRDARREAPLHTHLITSSFSRTRPHPGSIFAELKSNKRLRKPD